MRAELASMRALQQSQTQQLQALLVRTQAQSEFAIMQSKTQVQFCRQLQRMEGILVRNDVLDVMRAFLCLGPSYLLISTLLTTWLFH